MATTIDQALLVVDADTSRAVAATNAYAVATDKAATSTTGLTSAIVRETTSTQQGATVARDGARAHDEVGAAAGRSAKEHDKHGVSLNSYRQHMRSANREARFWSMELQNVMGAQKGLSKELALFVPLISGGGGVFMAIEAVRIGLELWHEHSVKASEAMKLSAERSIATAKAIAEEAKEWDGLAEQVEKYRRIQAGGPVDLLPSEATLEKRVRAITQQMAEAQAEMGNLTKPWTDAAAMKAVEIPLRFNTEEMDPAVLKRLFVDARKIDLPKEIQKKYDDLAATFADLSGKLVEAQRQAEIFKKDLDPTVEAERARTAYAEMATSLDKALLSPVVGGKKVWYEFNDWFVKTVGTMGQEGADRLAQQLLPGVRRAAAMAQAELKNANFSAGMDIVGAKPDAGLAVWSAFGAKVEAIAKEQGAAAGFAFYNQWGAAVAIAASKADNKAIREALSKSGGMTEEQKIRFSLEVETDKLKGQSPEVAAAVGEILTAAANSAIGVADLVAQGAQEQARREMSQYAKGLKDSTEAGDVRATIQEIYGYVPTDFDGYARAKQEADQLIALRAETLAQIQAIEFQYSSYDDSADVAAEKERRITEIKEIEANKRAGIMRRESILEQAIYSAGRSFAGAMQASLTQSFGTMTNSVSRYERAMRGMGQAQQITLAGMVGALAQSVAAELNAIAAKSIVWALWETAQGIGAAASMNFPAAAAHFTAAGMYAAIGGAALVGAAAINAVRPMSDQEQMQLSQTEQQNAQANATGNVGGNSKDNLDTGASSLPPEQTKTVNLTVNFSGQAMATKAEIAAELDEVMRYLDGWRG